MTDYVGVYILQTNEIAGVTKMEKITKLKNGNQNEKMYIIQLHDYLTYIIPPR